MMYSDDVSIFRKQLHIELSLSKLLRRESECFFSYILSQQVIRKGGPGNILRALS